jgi:D-alanyl-lipoteichoic acid acyltransferase DltB (MBOAT superfamily)
MLFNSLDFAVFLPIVFALYWLMGSRRISAQNTLILLASYVFYGWWDWRFLLLIVFSTLVDFSVARAMGNSENDSKRKALLWLSILVNLGLLGFFKYANFFIDNFISAFSFFGAEIQPNTLNIILPVGISFYTFQTLSNTIDVYRHKLEPTTDFIAFGAFVSFFPQLVAGPIERASNLLPQFKRKRSFDYSSAVNGLRQILWGLFKKMVIADNCAQYADMTFNGADNYGGSTLLFGAVFFAFQIYGDFSGYSDIAIGTARLFGFDLMKNFAFPYFSQDIAEFWRRWHISLSTWFRDYLYIPLGGSRVGRPKVIRNIFIIFLVSGFWHGANWTFIVWGALNALYFLPLLLINKNRQHLNVIAENKWLPGWKELFSMLATFGLTCLAWVFFRAESLPDAFSYLDGILSSSVLSVPTMLDNNDFPLTLLLLGVFIVAEWLGRHHDFALEGITGVRSRMIRWSVYAVLVFGIGMFMQAEGSAFIYFQF